MNDTQTISIVNIIEHIKMYFLIDKFEYILVRFYQY